MNDSSRPRFVVPLSIPLPGQAALPSPGETQESAVRQFIARVGGVASARAALELLALLQATRSDAPRKAA